jgi:hypothetical protein
MGPSAVNQPGLLGGPVSSFLRDPIPSHYIVDVDTAMADAADGKRTPEEYSITR